MKPENLVCENVKVKFMSFGGRVSKYDPRGEKKSFNVILDPTVVDINRLLEQGWKIEAWQSEVNEGDPEYSLKVQARWSDKGGPVVAIVYKNENQITYLDEASVASLDNLPIESVDCVIRPYEYEPGKISAYLNEAYFTVKEGPFLNKYKNFERT